MSGMFCNVLKFENEVKAAIQPMDHKNIDVDIPWFKERVSTMENISIYIWERMKDTMEDPDRLFEVTVQEREGSRVSYRGE
ncbi:6-pyruvoyl tetrahydrobiopterin synthase [Holothuria leucospilota]|uniref:6-pyruvoyltetrahydropterin synthase n=1 Tax=Holothuria leucospilota TaxID=206669 RepID=A0A9Q1BMV7_HOLLE|nr:6-pyruvoyl tetrahydrobiopterin synthase [Holothuria leucospilota]